MPYAGTAEDGRRFFLSDELFDLGGADDAGSAYVGLFVWRADGTFDEVRVDEVARLHRLLRAVGRPRVRHLGAG